MWIFLHEEDSFFTQQAINIEKKKQKQKKYPESRVCMASDDTDVFALLLYFYLSEKLQSSMIMQSPIDCRFCIDIKELLAGILIYTWS